MHRNNSYSDISYEFGEGVLWEEGEEGLAGIGWVSLKTRWSDF